MSHIHSTETLAPTVRPKRVSLRKPIRLMGMGFIPYMTWIWVVTGVPLTVLAKMLNMSEFGFGLLGGLFTYTQVSRLLGSYVIERFGHRKLTVVTSGFIHRGIWLLIALLPFFVGSGNWTWIVLLILAYFSHFGSAFADPGLASWIADLVPGKIQGRFYGNRMRLGLYASLVALVIVSYILDKAEMGGSGWLKYSLIGIFIFAAISGMMEYVLYSCAYNPPMKRSPTHVSLWKIIWKPLADKEFVSFLCLYCTMYGSAVFQGLFTFLFLLDVIKLSNVTTTILAVMAPNLVNAICYPFWGRITDRVGYKPALVIGAIGYIIFPLWYVLATPANWISLYIFGMFAFCLTSAIDTGTAVLMYTKITGGKDKNSDLGSSYPAVTGVTCAIVGAVMSIFAGAIASWIGQDWHGSVEGHPITYHNILFAIMVGIRIIALVGLLGIKNLSHSSLIGTVKIIGQELLNIVSKHKRFLTS